MGNVKCRSLYYYYDYYYLTAIGLTPGGSSTVHIYTQTVHRAQRTEHTKHLKRKKLGSKLGSAGKYCDAKHLNG
jgi:hypothetical protein